MKEKIRSIGQELGFDTVAFCKPEASVFVPEVKDWVKNGMHGEMLWFENNLEKRFDISQLLQSAQSVISCSIRYNIADIPESLLNDPSRAVFARYAMVDDYHEVLLEMLEDFARRIEKLLGKTFGYKAYVDTGPILEREMALRSGSGFIGNNTMLINKDMGSFTFLCELITDIDIPEDRVEGYLGGCGACTLCQTACPTSAFVAPRILDARKCISYLTIEAKGLIPLIYRPMMKNRVYGCDICQEVCPWNIKIPQYKNKNIFHLREDLLCPPIVDILALSQEDFSQKFKNSAVKRTKRRGLLRNTLVAAGNWKNSEVLPWVYKLLRDEEELIRASTIWTLFQIGNTHAPYIDEIHSELKNHLIQENSPLVLSEIQAFFPKTL